VVLQISRILWLPFLCGQPVISGIQDEEIPSVQCVLCNTTLARNRKGANIGTWPSGPGRGLREGWRWGLFKDSNYTFTRETIFNTVISFETDQRSEHTCPALSKTARIGNRGRLGRGKRLTHI